MAVASAATDPAPVAPSAAPDGMSPQSMPHYLLLERALLQYQSLAESADLGQIAPLPGRSIKPGEAWEGMVAVRRLLIALGDLAHVPVAVMPTAETLLDPALVAALQRFQA